MSIRRLQHAVTNAAAAAMLAVAFGAACAADAPARPGAAQKPRLESQLMFYVPLCKDTGTMWDTWLYHHENRYYLYYLARRGAQWDNISLAVSDDGVRWHERGVILSKADGVTWMGTGSTWKSPNFEKDRKFLLNFSEWRGPRQTIFFAESEDLLHWTRLSSRYEFKQDTRWYQENGRWDCIWTIPRDGGGLFGYWTADPKDRPGVGFGQSSDGVTWEALKPPLFEAGAPHGEAGAVQRIGGRYYLMLGSGGSMVTLIAERPSGPFRPAAKNFRLLAGHTYFSRFFPTPGGLLVNHHSIARDGKVYMGTLKRAAVDDAGTLRLTWWEGNDRLKHSPVTVQWPATGDGDRPPVTMLDNSFDTTSGLILEGRLRVASAGTSGPVGIFVEDETGTNAAVLVDGKGVSDIGPIRADGSAFRSEQRADREMPVGSVVRFRLLLKHSLLEFYVDDVLMHCYSMPGPATGRVGCVAPSGRAADRDWQAWQCPTSLSGE